MMSEDTNHILYDFDGGDNDPIEKVISTFSWISEIFTEKHQQVLRVLFDVLPHEADDLLAEDESYVQWHRLIASFKDFQDRLCINEAAAFAGDNTAPRPDFQDFEAPFDDLIASVEMLLKTLNDAKPALAMYKALLLACLSGKAKWDNYKIIAVRGVPLNDKSE